MTPHPSEEAEPAEDLVVAFTADDIDETFVPRHNALVSYVELDDELVVAAAPDGSRHFDAHWLDRSAALIWSNFDGIVSLGELIDELSDAFGTDRGIVRDDVLDLARTLGRAGLLEGVAFEPPKPVVPVRPDGLPIGTEIPSFSLTDLDGRRVTSDDTHGRAHVFVNWSPSCGFCVRVAPDLAALVPGLRAAGFDLVLIASGSVADNRRVLDDAGLACRVLGREDYALFDGFGTPTAYVVAADGTIGSELVVGAVEVPALLRRLVERP